MFGGDSTSLTAASKYASSHGGGTVAVESQSSAAAAILAGDTNVAGIGGFSGRETTVSIQWLAMEVRDGKIRYLLNTTSGGGGGGGGGGTRGGFGGFGGTGTGSSTGAPSFGGHSGAGGFGGAGDSRDGSAKAIAAAEKVAKKITVTENGTKVTLYDLQGKAAAILAQANASTSTSAGSAT
jgi:hypothetical protein